MSTPLQHRRHPRLPCLRLRRFRRLSTSLRQFPHPSQFRRLSQFRHPSQLRRLSQLRR
ncbi:MAG: hypothetical protein JNG84_07535, partial [Archangium sp.]|nr:hypothetical protein [Archangium sp.]